jgi:hypothetical protein
MRGFIHIENPRSCNFMFIDSILQHIKELTTILLNTQALANDVASGCRKLSWG